MKKARHHHREERRGGGKVEPDVKPKAYNAQGSKVEEEAEEKKRGGKVKAKHHKKEHHGEVEGHRGKRRLDRPGRKRGGSVGADRHPLSSASKVTPAAGRKGTMSGDGSEGP